MSASAGRGHKLGRADLHVHTSYGDGMARGAALLDYIEQRTDLSIVGIVDHDDLEGALRTRDVWARGRYSFELAVGVELTTQEGHLLALDIDRPIKAIRPLATTIRAIHEAGGFCVVPHPLSWLTRSIGRNGLDRVLDSPDPLVYFDGIEVVNQSPAGRVTSGRAQELNSSSWRLPPMGGSDGHFLQAIGTAYTTFLGHTLAGLRRALSEGGTGVGTEPYPGVRELGLVQVARQQLRGLAVTPRNVVLRPLARGFRRSTA